MTKAHWIKRIVIVVLVIIQTPLAARQKTYGEPLAGWSILDVPERHYCLAQRQKADSKPWFGAGLMVDTSQSVIGLEDVPDLRQSPRHQISFDFGYGKIYRFSMRHMTRTLIMGAFNGSGLFDDLRRFAPVSISLDGRPLALDISNIRAATDAALDCGEQRYRQHYINRDGRYFAFGPSWKVQIDPRFHRCRIDMANATVRFGIYPDGSSYALVGYREWQMKSGQQYRVRYRFGPGPYRTLSARATLWGGIPALAMHFKDPNMLEEIAAAPKFSMRWENGGTDLDIGSNAPYLRDCELDRIRRPLIQG